LGSWLISAFSRGHLQNAGLPEALDIVGSLQNLFDNAPTEAQAAQAGQVCVFLFRGGRDCGCFFSFFAMKQVEYGVHLCQ